MVYNSIQENDHQKNGICYRCHFYNNNSSKCAKYIQREKVIDEITRQPIEYAGVSSGISGKTAVTDKSGDFQLSLPSDTATLLISFVGYTSQQQKPGTIPAV